MSGTLVVKSLVFYPRLYFVRGINFQNGRLQLRSVHVFTFSSYQWWDSGTAVCMLDTLDYYKAHITKLQLVMMMKQKDYLEC